MVRKQAFTHDYGARNDMRLISVRMHLGMAGIGIYWCIIETMFEQGGVLPVGIIKTMSVDYNTDIEIIQSVVNDFGLFDTDGKVFWSPSANRRMKHKQAISEKRRMAGRRGGAPIGNTYARRSGKPSQKQQEKAVLVETPTAPVEPTKNEQKTTPMIQGQEVELSKPRKRFVPPTIDEVREENERKGYHVDAESFVAFYESKGWLVGKTPMKSWKSAMVTWEKRRLAEVNRTTTNNNVNDIWK